MFAVTGKLGVFGRSRNDQESTVISTLKKQANDYDKDREGDIGCNSFCSAKSQKFDAEIHQVFYHIHIKHLTVSNPQRSYLKTQCYHRQL
jgi:hypothetical protein